MDFIQMVQGAEGVTFLVNWEALAFTTNQWWLIALGVSAVYGIVTHARSLVQISRWNKRMDARFDVELKGWKMDNPTGDSTRYGYPTRNDMTKKLQEWGLVPMALYRLFLNLPIRVVTMTIGVIGMMMLFGCSGKMRMNPLLRWGWGWTLPPRQLRVIMNEGPSAIGCRDWNNEDYA